MRASFLFPLPFDPTIERPQLLAGEAGGILDRERLAFAFRDRSDFRCNAHPR